MFIDLTHNKIISETISAAFVRSVEQQLVPMLESRYGALLGIQMYEDHLADGFLSGGSWYYPLTLVFADSKKLLWIKWHISRGNYAGGNPYAYTGETLINFEIVDVLPDGFRDKAAGRAIFCEEGLIPIKIDAMVDDPAVLAGKYSQTFVDEMARQLTREIASSQGVSTLTGSSIELTLVFSPETYMEHTAESVTYRRLLISDKGCTPRDFWVKWTRLDTATPYTISDAPTPDTISFEIGEDVPQKVREREYRFIMRAGGDKFHSAMSRKKVTEWREILRRAIRRGDLVKVDLDETLSAQRDAELREQLSAILGVEAVPVAPVEKIEPTVNTAADDELVRLAREAIMGASAVEEEEIPVTVDASAVEEEKIPVTVGASAVEEEEIPVTVGASDVEEVEIPVTVGASDVEEEEIPITVDASVDAEPVVNDKFDIFALAEEEQLTIDLDAPAAEPEIEVEVTSDEPVEETPAQTEEQIRAEIEAKLRLEYEARARAAAEEEAARLRRENELLAEKVRLEAENKAKEQARMKAEIEAELRREAAEKERLAEQAMLAMEERRRLEAERAEAERLRKLEEAKAAEAKRVAEENTRREAERAEAERIRLEQKKQEELARKLAEESKPKYISKTAEFSFRRALDPNITKRIYEIVKGTIEYYGKQDVYIRIKASVPDDTTVRLEFLEVPESEMELVVNIIKVIGKSDLGVVKATLD